MAEQQFVGVVKSFNPVKGWGFIECDSSKAVYGTDIFLPKRALNGFAAQQGDQVAFGVQQNAKGVQADNAKLLSPETAAYYGEIKSWNPQKGWGFISSPASESVHGKDVFLLKSELHEAMVAVGTQLVFKVKPGDRGPIACNVQLLSTPAQAQMPQAMQSIVGHAVVGGWGAQQPQVIAFNNGGGYRAAPAQWAGVQAAVAAATRPQRIPSEKETYIGTLKSVNTEKGWGHIESQVVTKLYGKDLFVMRSALEGVSVAAGQTVAFNISQGPKGPHATNLRALPALSPQTMFYGTVKSYNETKGWGFIESPDAHQVLGTDVFMHKTDIPAGTPTPSSGEQVQFSVDVSTGRVVAKNIQCLGGGTGGNGLSQRYSPY